MKEFDLFVPLHYNDGSPIEARKLQRVQQILLDHFDGLTFFPQANQGFWKMAEVVYEDEIVIYRVLADKTRRARRVFHRLIAKLRKYLRQEEILVIEREVRKVE